MSANQVRLVKAKTCEGCRALVDEQGYGLRCKYTGYSCTAAGVPLAPCPKPRSYAQWLLIDRQVYMAKITVNAVTLRRVLQATSPGIRFGVADAVATLVREYNEQAGIQLLDTATVSKDALVAMLNALREHGLAGTGNGPVSELSAAVAASNESRAN